MVRAHVFISGDVIGVGYRSWTVNQANRLNLTGWVRNVYPEVEAIFEGEKDDVDEMVELCHEGPEVGFVEEVRVDWSEHKGEFTDFTIRKQ